MANKVSSSMLMGVLATMALLSYFVQPEPRDKEVRIFLGAMFACTWAICKKLDEMDRDAD